MMMPEDDEILKNGTVDFVSISYYSSNCVSVTQKGEITAANGGENIKNPYLETSAWGWQIDVLLVQKSLNPAEKNYKKDSDRKPFWRIIFLQKDF